ncbi:hypothetical protein M409DRAFT_18842 [Zasmidium cellare ATCC 36951]|uniref:Myb-like domain-containing protein n=1 Tax=Zasmidium cellare ATCC 36951 TaxID=1080233 RepID=A0A6A6CXD6_ZASCE|nr:uncharacterized protein M409DRAFT_18842 [Zasmidium cellare ATCC 36951]KAF2170870.1 hypothetical protein M409DRAFT_18842 [Zasmidium cellare ATCC 36951]
MSSMLISSAAGKKAAPKGAVRRRPAAAPGPAAPSQTTPSAPTSVAPQSPPPTEPPIQTPTVEESAPTERVELAEKESQPTSELQREQTQQDAVEQQPEAEAIHDATPVLEREATCVIQPATAQVDIQQEADAAEPEKQRETPIEPVSDPKPTQQAPSQEPVQQPDPQQRAVEDTEPTPHVVKPTSALQPASAVKATTKRSRDGASASTTSRPAKRVKKSSARSNAKVQAEVQADDGAASSSATTPADTGDGSATPAPVDTRRTRGKQPAKKVTTTRTTRSKTKSAATITNSDDEDEAAPSPESPEDEISSETPAPKKAKQRRKRKQVRIAENTEVEGDGAGDNEKAGESDGQQESEESDPELHEIDPSAESLFQLSHDTRYGKISERGKKMAEIDWDEVAQKRRDEAEAIVANQPQGLPDAVVQSVEGPDGAAAETQAGETEQAPAQQAAGANTGNEAFLVDADGNIVLDEATVRHDATAQAMQAAETGAVEDVNDLTTHLNRTTWINNNRRDPIDRVPLWKWKSDPWTEEETDRFYDALAMFGSDFFIISKMFPGKNRRMIKAKFNREEKQDSKRVDNALMGKSTGKPMDLEHYSRETGRDMSVFMRYDNLEHAQGIINESIKDKHEAATAAAQQEAALAEEKAQREKEEKLEKSKASKKSRKQRAKAGGTLGGVPDED